MVCEEAFSLGPDLALPIVGRRLKHVVERVVKHHAGDGISVHNESHKQVRSVPVEPEQLLRFVGAAVAAQQVKVQRHAIARNAGNERHLAHAVQTLRQEPKLVLHAPLRHCQELSAVAKEHGVVGVDVVQPSSFFIRVSLSFDVDVVQVFLPPIRACGNLVLQLDDQLAKLLERHVGPMSVLIRTVALALQAAADGGVVVADEQLEKGQGKERRHARQQATVASARPVPRAEAEMDAATEDSLIQQTRVAVEKNGAVGQDARLHAAAQQSAQQTALGKIPSRGIASEQRAAGVEHHVIKTGALRSASVLAVASGRYFFGDRRVQAAQVVQSALCDCANVSGLGLLLRPRKGGVSEEVFELFERLVGLSLPLCLHRHRVSSCTIHKYVTPDCVKRVCQLKGAA